MKTSVRSQPVEILLVEDNPGDVRLTMEAFKEAGADDTINVVANGVEALTYLRGEGDGRKRFRPDLIVLDLNLPKKDGRELLREIKGDPDLCVIPVVVLTSSRAGEDVDAAYRLHANCYITKPPDVEEFMRVVQSIRDFWLGVATLPAGY